MKVKGKYFSLLVGAEFAALLLVSAPALATVATAPNLGVAQQFGVLGNSGVTGSAGAGTVVNGDVGSGPTSASISNFGPSSTTPPFIVHFVVDGTVSQAHTDANLAYLSLAGQGTGTALGNNLSIVGPLTPGVYSTGAGDLGASTNLTLNDPSPGKTGIFVFNVSSSLTMNGSSIVTGTANPCNVYWRVGSSATLNGLSFMGTVIADTSITVSSASIVSGRLLAGAVTGTGVVTMAVGGNTIGGCSAAVPAQGGVALSKAFLPAVIISPGGVSVLTITLSNNDAVNAATLTQDLTDNLLGGLVIAPTPNASTTCGSGVVTATPGGTQVKLLSGATIPSGTPGTCTVTVSVTQPTTTGGSFDNTLDANTLVATHGQDSVSNPDAASSILIVAFVAVPTLSEWAMIMLAALLVLIGVAGIRRHAM